MRTIEVLENLYKNNEAAKERCKMRRNYKDCKETMRMTMRIVQVL